ncbi:MAG: phosphonate ABC transporter, permease protein PhnE [Reyranella sp.]|nr:phosphonate ABC transporter, permease protein PhnE [Reyranella sp.]MDP3163484.1 phosphonate ABC transporter, permease protein PhnE [Reyranella sp.]
MSVSRAAAQFERQYAEYRRSKTVWTVLFWALFAVCFVVSLVVTRVDVVALFEGLPRTTDFIVKMIPPIGWSTFGADVGEWYWGIGKWLNSLLNTLLMAYLATVLGTAIGGTLSFLAARNLVKSYAVYWITRRVLEIARTVPDIVWALLFVLAFGIGPLAGVLAITVHTLGAQGKLFAEVNENVSSLPIEGIRSSGGNWLHEMRYGVLPQALPNYMSYTFWRIELNVRSATIVGFVGAGGIGHDLFTSIQLLYFADAGAILLIVVATIMGIDMLSERFRHRLIGKEQLSQ